MRRGERDARGKALAEHAEPDDQIGDDQIGFSLADPRADAPRQKFGVALDIGDQREKLLRRIGKDALLGMGRHPQPSWPGSTRPSPDAHRDPRVKPGDDELISIFIGRARGPEPGKIVARVIGRAGQGRG